MESSNMEFWWKNSNFNSWIVDRTWILIKVVVGFFWIAALTRGKFTVKKRVPLIWAVEWLSGEIHSPLILMFAQSNHQYERWEKFQKIVVLSYCSYWWLHSANINMSSTAQNDRKFKIILNNNLVYQSVKFKEY